MQPLCSPSTVRKSVWYNSLMCPRCCVCLLLLCSTSLSLDIEQSEASISPSGFSGILQRSSTADAAVKTTGVKDVAMVQHPGSVQIALQRNDTAAVYDAALRGDQPKAAADAAGPSRLLSSNLLWPGRQQQQQQQRLTPDILQQAQQQQQLQRTPFSASGAHGPDHHVSSGAGARAGDRSGDWSSDSSASGRQ